MVNKGVTNAPIVSTEAYPLLTPLSKRKHIILVTIPHSQTTSWSKAWYDVIYKTLYKESKRLLNKHKYDIPNIIIEPSLAHDPVIGELRVFSSDESPVIEKNVTWASHCFDSSDNKAL